MYATSTCDAFLTTNVSAFVVCRLMYSKASRVEFSHVQTREVQIKVGNRSRDDDLVMLAMICFMFANA